jgi:hypothetical protein
MWQDNKAKYHRHAGTELTYCATIQMRPTLTKVLENDKICHHFALNMCLYK